jgi:SpoVK/Ycf46/Vps4 family AAA+-type ATPase
MKWNNTDRRWDTRRPSVEHDTLPAGVYKLRADMSSIWLEQQVVSNDQLLLLPDTATAAVATNIRRFWNSEEVFQRLGLSYKRGVLFHGAPGTGKSACISLLQNELVAAGGVVLVEPNPAGMHEAIAMVRQVEPRRQLICVMEDIESYLDRYEEQLLSMLSGQDETTHIVFLATTNFFDALPDRLRNRPSRFDEVVEILPPSLEARSAYLAAKVPGDLLPDYVRQHWAEQTEGLTIAHLRELIVGVVAMGRPFEETLARLRNMNVSPPAKAKRGNSRDPLSRLFEAAKRAAQEPQPYGISTKALGEDQ